MCTRLPTLTFIYRCPRRSAIICPFRPSLFIYSFTCLVFKKKWHNCNNNHNNNNNTNSNNEVTHALLALTPRAYFQSVHPSGFDLSSCAINLSCSAIFALHFLHPSNQLNHPAMLSFPLHLILNPCSLFTFIFYLSYTLNLVVSHDPFIVCPGMFASCPTLLSRRLSCSYYVLLCPSVHSVLFVLSSTSSVRLVCIVQKHESKETCNLLQ